MSHEQHSAFSPERELLRARHGVRAILSEEEGVDVKHLPAGVYGFTAAPAAPQLPLFIQPIVRGTEVHKVEDGEIYLIGYVEPAEAEQLASGSESPRLNLYPEPHDQAVSLVAIPMSRMGHRHPPTRDGGNSMAVEVGPLE